MPISLFEGDNLFDMHYIYIYIYIYIYVYICIVFTSKGCHYSLFHPRGMKQEPRDDSFSDETGCSGNLFEVKTILFALSTWYRTLFGISLTKTLLRIYIYIYIYIYYIYIYIYIYI